MKKQDNTVDDDATQEFRDKSAGERAAVMSSTRVVDGPNTEVGGGRSTSAGLTGYQGG